MTSTHKIASPGDQWETISFVLYLFKDLDDKKAEKKNIIKILEQSGPGKSPEVSIEKWWFAANFTYKDVKGIVQNVAEEGGFQVTPQKYGTRNGTSMKIICTDRKKNKCPFTFTLHECPERKRWYLQSPGSCCWTHINHKRCGGIHPLEQPTTIEETDEINKIFIRHQGTSHTQVSSTERLEKIVAIPNKIDQFCKSIWIEVLETFGRDEDKAFLKEGKYFYSKKYRPSISYWQVRYQLQILTAIASDTRVFYCPYDENLSKVINESVKPTLDSGIFPFKRRVNHFSRSSDPNWFLDDHTYYDWQLYSYDARAKTTKNIGTGKKPMLKHMTDDDKICTLGNEDHGIHLNSPYCVNIDTYDDEKKCWTLHPMFDFFEQRGFHGMRAGSYHKAESELKERMTCYRGHCDLRFFDYVIFTMVNGWMWVFVAVPKGDNVTGNSNKEFYEWFENFHDGKEKENIRNYVKTVEKMAPEEMQNVKDVDIHIFKLVAGGFLAFDAHILYHSTLTPKQDTEGHRQLIILHRLLWQ